MWLPVDIHSESAKKGGIVQAFQSHLAKGKLCYLVQNRVLVNRSLKCIGEKSAKEIVSDFELCSVSYVGTSHAQPCPPFLAATVSEGLGLAYIEHIIDLDPVKGAKVLSGFSKNMMESLCYLIFKDYKVVNSIVIPLMLPEATINEYRTKIEGEKTIVYRT